VTATSLFRSLGTAMSRPEGQKLRVLVNWSPTEASERVAGATSASRESLALPSTLAEVGAAALPSADLTIPLLPPTERTRQEPNA
jgi:hypothetical protein